MNIKKLGAFVIGLAMVVGPAAALADTSANAQVQAMLTQIQTLQAQIQALKTAQVQVQTSAGNVLNTLSLIRGLKLGMSGNDVTTLQTILAADPSVYPEGLVSGFFGKLTGEAVKKFQKKHGLETVGNVGPKTLKKLNEEIANLGLSHDDDDNASSTPSQNGEHGNKLCIPPGHMIAPGWLKHHDKPVPTALVPLCNNKHDNDDDHHATSTPDTIAPIISGIGAVPSFGSGTVSWTTNESATTKVYYSTSSSFDITASTTLSVSNSSLVLGHSALLSGLSSVTTYYYVVQSRDASGNTATSAVNSFTTTAIPDTSAPILSSIGTSNLLGTTTSIVWNTNESSNSKVWFGTTNPLVLASSTVVSGSSMVTSHSVPLSGLATSTTYFYVVVSTDASNNTATSTQNSFLTTAGL